MVRVRVLWLESSVLLWLTFRAVVFFCQLPSRPIPQVMYFLLPTISTVIIQAYAVSEYYNGDGTVDLFMTVDQTLPASGTRYQAILTYGKKPGPVNG